MQTDADRLIISVLAAFLTAGCTLGVQSMGVSIWEEGNECGFRVSNVEQQQAMKPSGGCIRWLGDKCHLQYGDDCEQMKD